MEYSLESLEAATSIKELYAMSQVLKERGVDPMAVNDAVMKRKNELVFEKQSVSHFKRILPAGVTIMEKRFTSISYVVSHLNAGRIDVRSDGTLVL